MRKTNTTRLGLKEQLTWLVITIFVTLGFLLIVWNEWELRFSWSDGIAQFMPMALESWRAVKSGNLPLYNFWQFAGMPMMAFGYFPVMYPLTWIAGGMSDWFLSDPHQIWNVLVAMQIMTTAVVVHMFLAFQFRLRPSLATVGALSVTFAGYPFGIAGAWLYAAVVPCYAVAISWAMARIWLKGISALRLTAVSMTTFLFMASSNVNFVFYGAHVAAALFFTIILWTPQNPNFRPLKKRAVAMTLASMAAGLGVAPILWPILEFLPESFRQPEAVSLDKYFWTTADWSLAVKGTILPLLAPENLPDLNAKKSTYYLGPVAVFGLAAIVPMAFAFGGKSVEWKRKLIGTGLLATVAVATFLISLGPTGYIGKILYYIPPYNWFRQISKWMVCYQTAGALAGVLATGMLIDGILKTPASWLSLRNRKWLARSTCGVSLLITLFALSLHVRASQTVTSFTEVKLPLPRPTIATTREFRHVGIWMKASEADLVYLTGNPARLLGHNYSTAWQLPTTLGYEPMMGKWQAIASDSLWFPGFIRGWEELHLDNLENWRVRYYRTVPEETTKVLQFLQKARPAESFKVIGRDPSLNVDVIEREAVKPVVWGPDVQVIDVTYDIGRAINITANASKPSRLTVAWTPGRHLRVEVDSVHQSMDWDDKNRIVVSLPGTGISKVRIEYRPKNTLTLLGLFFVVTGGLALWGSWSAIQQKSFKMPRVFLT
jgi:hypothetical protein